MIELRRCLGLPQESLADIGAKRELGRQDLQCDTSLQSAVPGTVHNARAAASKLRLYVVAGLDGLRHACEKFRVGVARMCQLSMKKCRS